MSNPDDLIYKTQQLVGGEDQVIAAGIFALSDDYKAIAKNSIITGLLTPSDNAIVEGLETGAVLEGTRQHEAHKQGLSARMIVAVSEKSIYIFSLPVTGSQPQQELFCFDRESTDIEIKKFGLSRHLNLQPQTGNKKLKLTGTTVKFLPEGAGDRKVLSLLASQ
jgi:hypothetical protein